MKKSDKFLKAVKDTLDRILSLVFVPKCVGCGTRLAKRDLFCEKCYAEYMSARDDECIACHRRIDSCTCSTKSLEGQGISKYIKLMRYKKGEETPTNRMAYELKESHNTELIRFFAHQLAVPVRKYAAGKNHEVAVTYVPRSKRAIIRYGYDHSELLAKEMARLLGFPFVRAIERCGSRVQKTSNARERRINAARSFSFNPAANVEKRHFILVDDIVTTGATVVACKNLLKRAGATSVTVASVYQAIEK
ncbi:MAG: ComF family protein [Clostridia bacterium]|nr:ComF family protein [Clostridia bacterium]